MLKVAISKRLPGFELAVEFQLDRQILVLFGPSGAGKSLTLSCIAGLVEPDAGTIELGEQVLYQAGAGKEGRSVPPHKRGIGVVFQGYALFPHLTVAQNVAYGLRYHKRPTQDVSDMLHRLRLEQLAGRYPHQLSGGQQQRVALGRALIIQPQLLLLDEPFAALDMGIREQLQVDIRALQQELNLTIVYVTHSLEDTFVLGDKLAVLQAGRLQQIGPTNEVFHRPNSLSVAEITGVKNIWQGEVVSSELSGLRLRWGNRLIDLPPANRDVGERVIFYIRPEHVKIIHPDKPLTGAVRHNILKGVVTNVVNRGSYISVTVSHSEAPAQIQLRFPQHSYGDLQLQQGSEVTVSLLRHMIVLLPEGS